MTAFDFSQSLVPGLPPPAARWTGFPKYNFVGGHNDSELLPVDALVAAANAVLKREGATLATYGLNSGPQGYRPLREFLAAKLKRAAGIACTADEILIVSGSLQALDLVNGILLARGDTVIIEQDSYQGALTRLARLGVRAIGIPLDRDGMRVDALAEALAELKRSGVRPKYIYTVPTVQNPTGTILSEARRLELLRLAGEYGVPIFEDDCYSDLIWDGVRPPALYAMSQNGGVIHIGSFSKSIAPALRVGYIVALGCAGAHAAAQDRCRLRRARADGVGRVLPRAFRCAPAGAAPGLAQKTRNFDGRARRTVRHRGRIRRSEGRHFPMGQAA
jgi:2-aminoadipate transaminase